MAVKHTKVLAGADGVDATLIRPSNWNANHSVEAGTLLRGHLAPEASGFDYLGGIEIGTAALSTGVITFEPVDTLLFLINATTPTGDIPQLRFNSDTTANYSHTRLKATEGGLSAIVATFSAIATPNATAVPLHSANATTARNQLVSMSNATGRSKIGGFQAAISTGSAAILGVIEVGGFEYHGLDLVTQVEMDTVSGTNLEAGSILMVFGKAIP